MISHQPLCVSTMLCHHFSHFVFHNGHFSFLLRGVDPLLHSSLAELILIAHFVFTITCKYNSLMDEMIYNIVDFVIHFHHGIFYNIQ